MEDGLIRKWLREADHAGQGWVDWTDFKYIFEATSIARASSAAKIHAAEKSAIGRTGDSPVPVGRLTSSKSSSLTATGVSLEHSSLYRDREDKRMQLLREAFSKYDLDGDGMISENDLRTSLGEQRCSDDEIRAWILRRDSSGSGAVAFEDFVTHYSSERSSSVGRKGEAFVSSPRRKSTVSSFDKGTMDTTDTLGRSKKMTFDVRKDPFQSVHRDSLTQRERSRIHLLREAFEGYDLDRDGFISKDDMKLAVGGIQCSDAEIESWLRKRDSTGQGKVSFEDFIKHYN